ncbi:hypothetical protein KR044_010380, partial [Drosophila immigrans]
FRMDLLRHCCAFLLIVGSVFSEYVIRVNRFEFRIEDREIITSQSSILEQDSNRSYLSGHLQFSRPISDIQLFTTMDIQRPKVPRMRLFEKKMDLCSFFSNNYRSKFVRQLYNNYMSFINEPPKCPLKANFNYSLHRAYVDDSYLPDFLPECRFFMKLEFSHKSKRTANMIFTGELGPVN